MPSPAQTQNPIEQQPSFTVKVEEEEVYSVRVLKWVDEYLKHPGAVPFGIFAGIVLIAAAFGAIVHWSWQQIRHDTFQQGFEARELEQLHNEGFEANMRVDAVIGQLVRLQPLNPDLSLRGRPIVHRICPGWPIRWKAGEVVEKFRYEYQPNGDGGRGCESIGYPETGFTMWRDDGLESVNLFVNEKGFLH